MPAENPYPPSSKFVQLDGSWYEIGDDEHTTTGLVIPVLTPYVEELPEGAKLRAEDAFAKLGEAGKKTEAEIKKLTAKAKKKG